jgi:hypothetical protein
LGGQFAVVQKSKTVVEGPTICWRPAGRTYAGLFRLERRWTAPLPGQVSPGDHADPHGQGFASNRRTPGRPGWRTGLTSGLSPAGVEETDIGCDQSPWRSVTTDWFFPIGRGANAIDQAEDTGNVGPNWPGRPPCWGCGLETNQELGVPGRAFEGERQRSRPSWLAVRGGQRGPLTAGDPPEPGRVAARSSGHHEPPVSPPGPDWLAWPTGVAGRRPQPPPGLGVVDTSLASPASDAAPPGNPARARLAGPAHPARPNPVEPSSRRVWA